MTTHQLHGGCHCGNLVIHAEFTGALTAFTPRACDCDFCRKHAAAYVSDSSGRLRIEYKDSDQIGRYRQGSGLVDCLLCRHCGVLIGAMYQEGGQIFATVNSKALDGKLLFGNESEVSPKLLTDEQKIERWKSLWFHNVSIEAVSA